MSDRVCIGRCNAGQRRRAEEHARALAAWQAETNAWIHATDQDTRGPEPAQPVEPTLRWNAGTPIWCLSDSAAIRSALADLDEQMALRFLAGDGHGSINLNERVSSSPEPNSPSPAHDDCDELIRWLREWENEYRSSRGWPTSPHRGEAAPALTSSVAWFLTHLDDILTRPDFSEGFGTGVLYWHNRLSSAAKTRPRRMSKQLRCPQCHLATLSQIEGEDRIECRNRDCGASRGGPMVMTVEEYEGRAHETIEAAKVRRRAS
ncbi:hypothetical protein AB0F88_39995 [Streptosporangium sp. NPDC023963]|uniref:hypothetical protein n=1 Tax=Streptosporangium sp. NPDC023963 TaxID=3155608 RepID=UPI0034439503